MGNKGSKNKKEVQLNTPKEHEVEIIEAMVEDPKHIEDKDPQASVVMHHVIS